MPTGLGPTEDPGRRARGELEHEQRAQVSRSRRKVVWTQRRRSMARTWAAYRRSKMGIAGLFILVFFISVAVLAPVLAPHQALTATGAKGIPLQGPSIQYPFGTDNLGRSVLALTIWGSRVSLFVGLMATLISTLIGSAVGIVAGYFGRWSDSLLMRITDWFLAVPYLPLAIVLASLFGSSMWNIAFIIGILSWSGTARLIRAQTLSLKTRLYVDRARGLGGSNWYVMTRHILPNVSPLIFANTILIVGGAILSETTLSFLGLGDPLHVSWGTILDAAFSSGAAAGGWWWWLVAPGVAIVLVVLAFTMCGYAFDEILNPRMRRR